MLGNFETDVLSPRCQGSDSAAITLRLGCESVVVTTGSSPVLSVVDYFLALYSTGCLMIIFPCAADMSGGTILVPHTPAGPED